MLAGEDPARWPGKFLPEVFLATELTAQSDRGTLRA